jgi:hypothetical protein
LSVIIPNARAVPGKSERCPVDLGALSKARKIHVFLGGEQEPVNAASRHRTQPRMDDGTQLEARTPSSRGGSERVRYALV